MIHVDPPFDLGETLKGTEKIVDEDGALQTTLINEHWEGAVFEFPDVDRTPSVRGGKARRNGGRLKAVCVRNVSGGKLSVATATAGKALKFDKSQTGRKAATSVNGVALDAEDEWCGVGDPELGTTQVEDDDLFWLIIGGVVPVIAEGTIAVGTAFTADTGGDGHVIASDAANIFNMGVALDAGSDGNVFLGFIRVLY